MKKLTIKPSKMKFPDFSYVRPQKVIGFQKCLFLAAMILFFLSGCSRYQYISVIGDTHQNKQKDFVVENDTVKIVYSFSGVNFPVTVEVYNKLNKPVYVDWTKSALIVDGNSVSYWQDAARLEGSTNGYVIGGRNGVEYTFGSVDGTIYKNEKVSFIPPKSYIKTTRFYLKGRFFSTKKNESKRSESFNSSNGLDWRDIYIFNRENTPLNFKSYITLSTDKNFSKEFHFTNSFWVNNITQTMASPESLRNTDFPKTYIHKATVAGFFISFVVILGLAAAGLAVFK